MKQAAERYSHILEQVAMAGPDDDIESHLAEAFELGRSMVDRMVPPDEVTSIHHEAVVRLARRQPQLALVRVARNLTRPLMEMSMAYGLAFREQMERRYEGMINARQEQSRQLEAVDGLAAGFAHDFDNLLGSVIGFAEMARDALAEAAPGQQYIRQILNASFRARDLVARMLAFARQSPVKLARVDVVAEVREALELLRASLQASTRLSFETQAEQAIVIADPMQIQQVVMNLCINAADAMHDCGTIVVRLDLSQMHPDTAEKSVEWVCLTITDSGYGMPPEALERVFDPLSTTKAPNNGSGLGLSVVYGIVTRLGGVIEMKSRTRGSSTGTAFRLFLPLLTRASALSELDAGNPPMRHRP